MARVIKKSASEKGEVVIKEPSRFIKAVKKIKPIHLLIAWDVIVSCLVVALTILLIIRFVPDKVKVREASSIEEAVAKYNRELAEGTLPIVEEVLVEDLIDAKINDFNQVFVYAYDPDFEYGKTYWETDGNGNIIYTKEDKINWSKSKKYGDDIKKPSDYKGQYKYDEDEKAYKKSTGLYEQNSAIIIDLIDRLQQTTTSSDMWNTKLFIIDVTKKSNVREIKKIGGNEVSIDLSTEGLSQLLYVYNVDRDINNKIGSTSILNQNLLSQIEEIQANLYKYTINMYFDETQESVNLAYKEYLPISSNYNDDALKDLFYKNTEKDGYVPLFDWYSDESHEHIVHPDSDGESKVEYKNIDNKIQTVYNYYGVRK